MELEVFLTDDIWHYVFSFLDVKSLLRVAEVSRGMHGLSRSDNAWMYQKQRVLKTFPEFECIFKRFQRKNKGKRSKPKRSKTTAWYSPAGIWTVFVKQLLWIHKNNVCSITRAAIARWYFGMDYIIAMRWKKDVLYIWCADGRTAGINFDKYRMLVVWINPKTGYETRIEYHCYPMQTYADYVFLTTLEPVVQHVYDYFPTNHNKLHNMVLEK
jgi:hypothetical protein